MTAWLPTAIAIALLAAITFTLARVLRLEQPWLQPWSLLRAIVQLGLLSLVLGAIIEHTGFVLAFLVVMVVAAAVLVSRRLRWGWRLGATAGVVIAIAAAIPGLVVFGTGAMEFRPNYLLALGGIVVGGTMTASTLFARTLRDRLRTDRAEVEAWLALGATPRRAARDVVAKAGTLALLPTTDQTRVTGIVALPGAFVGAVFAGLPVLDAAVFQIVVLASLLAAGAIAIALWALVLGAPRTLPAD